MDGGLVTHCRIIDHKQSFGPTTKNGGGVYMTGGAIASCTIVANSIGSGPPSLGTGGRVYWTGGTVTNSVIFANFDRTTGATNNYSGLTSANTAYSFTAPDLGGSNISGDPLFVDLAGGDYSLQEISPCIDVGDNAAVTWTLDLADAIRKQYGGKFGTKAAPIVDMGAYEAPEPPPKGTMFMLR